MSEILKKLLEKYVKPQKKSTNKEQTKMTLSKREQ